MNVDEDVENVEEDGASVNHKNISEMLQIDEADCVGSDEDEFSDKAASDDMGDCSLEKFSKYKARMNQKNPKFEIGMLFSCREELKQAINTQAITNARDIKYIRNSGDKVRVVCKDASCGWFMYAYKLSGETGLQLRKCNFEHTCVPVYVNRTLTSSWLAKQYEKKFRNSPRYRSIDFRKEMRIKLGQHVSKWQAQRAKKAALKAIYGDESEQYSRIWDFCTEVVESNPGTKCYVKTVTNDEGQAVFQRWYLCWSACVKGFHSGCRRLIGVDGCHLKNKVGGQVLVAVQMDPNNNIFPIAYAVVEVENKASWEWFLAHLFEDIGTSDTEDNDVEQCDWTFMSDKQKGLIEAFKTVLPGVHHRFCVRHLHENFKRAGFRAQSYKEALWSATTSTTVQYFKEAMDKMKKLDASAYNWFEDKAASEWSRAYFMDDCKCDVLLNNMCEVFNSLILDARDKPILTLVSMIRDLILMRMQVNREKAEKWDGRICPKPRLKMLQNIKDASKCMPMKCDSTHFQVYSGTTANQCAVDLGNRNCTCRKWQLTGIPCKHAAAAIRYNGENVEDYVDECYSVSTYRKVYGYSIQPMSGPHLWPQTGRLGPLPPPFVRKKAGRTTRLRRYNPIEVENQPNVRVVQCKVRTYHCRICKESGHNYRTCKKKESTGVAGGPATQMDHDTQQFPSQESVQSKILTQEYVEPQVQVTPSKLSKAKVRRGGTQTTASH